MDWSGQQEKALQAAGAWMKQKQKTQLFRLFGYAGTGKTTIAKHLGDGIKVLFAAFTGKAAFVLRQKGCVGASTLHSLIYFTKERDGALHFKLNKESPVRRVDLLIVDECSMVDSALARDILSFKTPVLVLGDPAQLPPPSGAGAFTQHTPDILLTEIHRQALENPILAAASAVRAGGGLTVGDFGALKVLGRGGTRLRDLIDHDQIICGLNRTRVSMNAAIRKAVLSTTSPFPLRGDRLICTRNNAALGLFNGAIFTVLGVGSAEDGFMLELKSEDDGAEKRVFVREEFFSGGVETLPVWIRKQSAEFTYGYAITAHKAQGSQWDRVAILDESAVFREDRNRWLYTALTRAAKEATVLV